MGDDHIARTATSACNAPRVIPRSPLFPSRARAAMQRMQARWKADQMPRFCAGCGAELIPGHQPGTICLGCLRGFAEGVLDVLAEFTPVGR